MRQVFIQQGKAVVQDVPAPAVEPGTILVAVQASCISIGTELSGLRSSGTPLWRKILENPQKIRKGLQMVTSSGLRQTVAATSAKLTAAGVVGYSAAGTVLDVGEGVIDVLPGTRVACAGAQCAHHAEIIRVPRNLAVPIPDGVSIEEASTVTLGAIAMQGVRRAEPTLGETFVVIGLGILGQITTQLLAANGCRVIGVDLDRGRLEKAASLGMPLAIHPSEGVEDEQVARLTAGVGADGVIITAATPSDEVISTAFKCCRKKGRVVLVGDVGLNLKRSDFYEKELDFRISTSYGPGRYDRMYEEEGLDYPVAYVRWTENRNMAEYLRLIADRRVEVAGLVSRTYAIDEAPSAYEDIQQRSPQPLVVLLTYPDSGQARSRRVNLRINGKPAPGRVGLALVGAGAFARGSYFPNIGALAGRAKLRGVVSRTGHNAALAAKQFGADYATTDFEEVLADPEVNGVIVATRHHLHAEMAVRALRAGKHVLLEKPLALTEEGLSGIENCIADAGSHAPMLLTGFNRRFSPHIRKIDEHLKKRSHPMIVTYRMNAGYLPADHWVNGPEGGGRNLGEACHIYDLFTFLIGEEAKSIAVSSVAGDQGYYSHRDNFTVSIGWADGSLATLLYTSMGTTAFPKEQMEIFSDGRVFTLNDYRESRVAGSKATFKTSLSEKGHLQELEAFIDAIASGGEWPIPLWQQAQATRIALEAERQLARLGTLKG